MSQEVITIDDEMQAHIHSKDNWKGVYIRTSGFSMNQLSGREDFKLVGRPLINTDLRLERVTFKYPCPNTEINGISANTKITCTYRGGQCSSCRHASSNHRINDQPRLLIVADEHAPPLIGVDDDCALVTRIDGGDFQQHKAFLEWQTGEGLRIKKGSVCVVMLVTHIARVGQDKFWWELQDFAAWMAKKGCTVLPCLPPFPDTYNPEVMRCLQQFFVHLQAAHYGDIASGKNLRFSLWQPVCRLALDLKVKETEPNAPPVGVPELSNTSSASCNSTFFAGFSYKDGQPWTHHIPDTVEQGFVRSLIECVREIAASLPNTKDLVIPSDDSVAASFVADLADGSKHEGKTIYLVGSSILDDVADSLMNTASMAGVELINLAQRGSHRKHYICEGVDLPAVLQPLEGGGSDDLAVVSIFGNEMVKKRTAFCNRDMWHVSKPEMLNSAEMDELVKEAERITDTIRQVGFGGKILVLGPTPRHLVSCCKQDQHVLKDRDGKSVDWKVYTDVTNTYISKAINLTANVEFIPYQKIFGGGFGAGHLTDGVHLDEHADKALASFIFRSLERPQTAAVAAVANRQPFSAHLLREKIAPRDEERSDSEML